MRTVERLFGRQRRGGTRWPLLMGAVLLATGAAATNRLSKSGVETSGCAVTWRAATVMDVDLKDNDPNYPGLMTDLKGEAVKGGLNAYTNGGYIMEVRPEYGGSGILEINHWYNVTLDGVQTSFPNELTAAWRIPISTDYAMKNVTVTVTLPSYGAGSRTTFDPVSSNSRMYLWGIPYTNYTWAQSPTVTATDKGGGVWTVQLGDLPAKTGTVIQFDFTVPAGTDLSQQYIAKATLTGRYDYGSPSTCVPAPVPVNQPLALGLLGLLAALAAGWQLRTRA